MLFFRMKNGSGRLTDGLSMRKMFRVSEMIYRFIEIHLDEQWRNSFECANRKSVV